MSSSAATSTERRRPRPAARSRRRRGGAEGLDRLRVLLAGAMGAVLVGYALLVPVAGVLLASGGAGSLDGAFATAVPMWLAAHQLPVELDGRTLGVLPLVPTGVVVAVVLVASAWSVRRLGGRVRRDAGAVVATQAGAAAAVAVLAGALLPGDVAVATPWSSMVGAGLLAGLAASAGVLRACGLPGTWSRRLTGLPRAALAGARVGGTGLVCSGALVLLAALVLRADEVAASFATLAPGAGASAGLLVLVVGYLPNALVGAVSWTLGPGVAVGPVQSGPFGTVPGPLPSFPLFAAVPTDPAPAWSVLVLLLPLAVGVLTGRACLRVLDDGASLRDRVVVAGTASALVAPAAGVAAGLAGGSLAGGPYDPVSLSPFAVAGAALLLLGVPATIVCAGPDELLALRPALPRGALRGPRRRTTGERPGRDRSGRSVRTGPEDGSGPGSRSAPGDRSGAGARTGRRRDGAGRSGPDARPGTRPGAGAHPERTAPARSEKASGGAVRSDGVEGPGPDRDERPATEADERPGDDRGSGGAAGTGRERPRTVGELVAQQERDRQSP